MIVETTALCEQLIFHSANKHDNGVCVLTFGEVGRVYPNTSLFFDTVEQAQTELQKALDMVKGLAATAPKATEDTALAEVIFGDAADHT